MGIVEAIKKGFSLSGKLINIVALFFILNLIMGLVSLPLARPENAGNPTIAALSIAISLVFFLIFIFLQGGALGLVKDLHKTNACSVSNFSEYGKKYYVRILGLLLLYIAIAVVLVLVLGLAGSGILAIARNTFTSALVGGIAAIVAIATIVLLLYPIYALVADDSGVIQALKKGVQTGKENFWNTLGLFLLLALISVLISLVIGFVIGLITAPLPLTVSQVIITIVNSAVQSYLPIVMMVALMGYYLGLSAKPVGPEGPPA